MKQLKPLKDLTLLDKFLFDETMDHPEAHEALLQIILGQDDLKLMTPSQTEKEFRTMPWLRSHPMISLVRANTAIRSFPAVRKIKASNCWTVRSGFS